MLGIYQLQCSFPCGKGVALHFQVPEALTDAYSRVGIHVGPRCQSLLIQSQGDRELVSSIMDSRLSNQGNDIIRILFEDFLEKAEDVVRRRFVHACGCESLDASR